MYKIEGKVIKKIKELVNEHVSEINTGKNLGKWVKIKRLKGNKRGRIRNLER